ncbi:NucA/NucB deoxyribonuclease domain-containing protein [Dactylosporangium sp. NPDC005572]|uniref:NucA/NucB deoxyribonuclease domain-containing protein n=1 Tax=Dactylosporangium sp. NPDC005572 TaxID=3156889 RepID=UPI0033B86D3F
MITTVTTLRRLAAAAVIAALAATITVAPAHAGIVTVADAGYSMRPLGTAPRLDAEPVPFGSFAASRGPTSSGSQRTVQPMLTPEEDALRAACAQHADVAGTRTGWLSDRFQQCVRKRSGGVVIRDDNGQPAGELRFLLWVLARASSSSRQVTYTVRIEDITVSTIPPNVIDWPNQRIALSWRGCAGVADLACTTTNRDATIQSWFTDPEYRFTMSSPNGTGALPDLTVPADLFLDIRLGALPIRPTTLGDVAESKPRFDTGRRMSPANGAVFPDFMPTYSLSLTDPSVDDSARHIHDALNHPERTFPSFIGKSVPNELHRLVDETLQSVNRAQSIATCADIWGSWSETQPQCDEFPFASTREGSLTQTQFYGTHDRYSARLIHDNDNETAGSRLGTLYGQSRIIDGDAFKVRIDP